MAFAEGDSIWNGLRVRWCQWLDGRHVLRFRPANVDRRQLATGNWQLIYVFLQSPVIRNGASNMQLQLQLHKSKSNSFASDFAWGQQPLALQLLGKWSSQVISNEDIIVNSNSNNSICNSNCHCSGNSDWNPQQSLVKLWHKVLSF